MGAIAVFLTQEVASKVDCWDCPLRPIFKYSTPVLRSRGGKVGRARFFCVLFGLALTLYLTPATSAQDKPVETKPAETKPAETKPAEIILRIEKPIEGTLALYETIKIPVENLPEWINQKGNDPSKFILYVDGNAFKGLTPGLVDDNKKLRFDLKRVPDNKDNKDAWTAVLSRRPKQWERIVPVTVGLDNKPPIESTAQASLTVINRNWFKVFVAAFALAIALFWWLAYKSDIIRDNGPQPEEKDDKGNLSRKPYSLARTQMAFWFFIVIISYVFIWMVTSDISNLTTSVLALIGISAATGLGSAMVDSSKTSNQENKRRVAEEKKKKSLIELERLASEATTLKAVLIAAPQPTNLEKETAKLTAKEGERAAKEAEIAQAAEEIASLAAKEKTKPSKSFLNDILSDDDGVSFHRFQIFAWTIVLILIFIGSVFNGLAMPEFDTTLLLLMGISGGTFLGFKLPNQEG